MQQPTHQVPTHPISILSDSEPQPPAHRQHGDKELGELARIAGEAGAKGIVVAGSMLRNKARDKADS